MKKILLVDDDPLSIEFMKMFFETENFDPCCAGSCSEAKTAFREHMPDVVITDIELVDGSGVELARQMKETRDVLIVAVTGHSQEYLKEAEGEKISVFDLILTKPIDLETLKNAVS